MAGVLVVLEAGDRTASGVVRGLKYRELLIDHGFSPIFATRQPLAVMDWIGNLPFGIGRVVHRSAFKNQLLNWATRASERRIVERARTADVVYLVKVRSYPFVHAICQATTARVIYDLVDAKWLDDERPEALHDVLRRVDAVTTDNEITAEYLRRFNAHCVVVPDAPPLEEFDKRRSESPDRPDDRITLGWVGSPETVHNLYVIWEALEEVFRRHSHLHLRLVGTGPNLRLVPRFERVSVSSRASYNEADMVDEVLRMHIGLFPLQNVERSRVRGVLKASVYMSGGAVVVASPVGQCVEVIQDGVNGMLAASTDEWIAKLEAVIADGDLRRRLAHNALETVRTRFRRDQSFATLKDVLFPAEGNLQAAMPGAR